MGNLIEVEIENKSYIKLQDLDKSSKSILQLTTLVDNQPGAIIKVFLNRDGNRIPIKKFEVRHIKPKTSGIPRFELGSSYEKKRLHLELKVDGRKVEESEIKLAPYLRNKYLPLVIIIGIIAALLLILGGKWLITSVFPETAVSKTTIVSAEENTINPIQNTESLETTPVPIERSEKPAPPQQAEISVVRKTTIHEHTLYFSPNNTSIQKDAVLILKELAVKLINNAEAVVEITGHCAMSGTEAGREELSRERAYNTVTYLKKEGWRPETEPVMRWFGGTQPVTSNEEEIYRNRRVEIRIVLPE